MIYFSKLEKKNKEDIKKFVVEICQKKLLSKIQKKIDKGLNPFDAYDQVIKGHELGEEIILIYDIEAEKANLINKLDLKSNEITSIKKKVEKKLFNVLLNDISHS